MYQSTVYLVATLILVLTGCSSTPNLEEQNANRTEQQLLEDRNKEHQAWLDRNKRGDKTTDLVTSWTTSRRPDPRNVTESMCVATPNNTSSSNQKSAQSQLLISKSAIFLNSREGALSNDFIEQSGINIDDNIGLRFDRKLSDQWAVIDAVRYFQVIVEILQGDQLTVTYKLANSGQKASVTYSLNQFQQALDALKDC